MSESWTVIAALAIATFGIRLSGIFLGQSIPKDGRWARALQALPGCLIGIRLRPLFGLSRE